MTRSRRRCARSAIDRFNAMTAKSPNRRVVAPLMWRGEFSAREWRVLLAGMPAGVVLAMQGRRAIEQAISGVGTTRTVAVTATPEVWNAVLSDVLRGKDRAACAVGARLVAQLSRQDFTPRERDQELFSQTRKGGDEQETDAGNAA